MGNSRKDHITSALAALVSTADHQDRAAGDRELVVTMTDLASISELVGQLAQQTHRDVAGWATVAPHLQLAEEYAQGLARCLNHASGTLEYNSSLQP